MKKSDQNRQGIIYRHTRQRVRGGEDTGKVILRTLNYLPNDDVKSEYSQYMCNVCAENFTGVQGTGGTAESKRRLGVHLFKKTKRKGSILYMTSILDVFETFFMKIALTIPLFTEIRHTVQ